MSFKLLLPTLSILPIEREYSPPTPPSRANSHKKMAEDKIWDMSKWDRLVVLNYSTFIDIDSIMGKQVKIVDAKRFSVTTYVDPQTFFTLHN